MRKQISLENTDHREIRPLSQASYLNSGHPVISENHDHLCLACSCRQAFVNSSQTLFAITFKLISGELVNKKDMYRHILIPKLRAGSGIASQSAAEGDYQTLVPPQHSTDCKQLCGSGEQF